MNTKMYIKKIKWLDKGKEAVIKVVNGKESLICFSCPYSYNVGDILNESFRMFGYR